MNVDEQRLKHVCEQKHEKNPVENAFEHLTLVVVC